jgi:Cft2 family RNA processing exonuclease
MAARIHRPLKIIACNANYIWRQCYELSEQLQDLHIDVALLSETHLKPLRGSIFLIITFMILTASQEEKAELLLQ